MAHNDVVLWSVLLKAIRTAQGNVSASEKLARELGASFERITSKVKAFQRDMEPLARRLQERLVLAESGTHALVLRKVRAKGWVGLETLLGFLDLKTLSEQPDDALDTHVCELFAKNGHERLLLMVESWNDVPYLAGREELLADCVEAYKRGLWSVVIPALLPLVDGLSAEVVRQSTPNAAVQRINIDAVISEYRSDDAPDEYAELWSALAVDFVRNQVFASSDFAAAPPSNPLNRHWVLHGRVPDYWSRTNALQTFLLVHVVAHVARLSSRGEE